MNTLHYGDCLTIMRERMADKSVDLAYLDPPFNSKRDYNAIYKDETGRPLPDQVEAFNDTWTLDSERMRTIRGMQALLRRHEINGPNADLLAGMLTSLVHAQSDMAAYLAYMSERLIEIRRVLKRTGCIYLHCDPTASHYLKLVMDVIFGRRNFINEVIWHYRKWTNAARHFQRNHDVLLVYARSRSSHLFNKLTDPDAPQSAKYRRGWDTNVVAGGVRQLLVFDRKKARHKIESGQYDRIVYREEQREVALPDVWNLPIINSQAKERMGYPTQKPVALLDRIVRASSQPGDVVFDPFCGCATTVEAAEVN